jgi:hypothetical protein
MAAGRNSQRGRWPVVVVHGSVAGLVLVLVAVLALVVKPPAPPGIAAFAPQAAKPITKAPPAQSAQFGDGAGQCGRGQVCQGASPGPTAAPTVPPSPSAKPLTGAAPPGLQCYTWPDGTVTQTFDPQSPPCISRWDDSKGNGGATAPGVTGTEIRVAFGVNSNASLATWPGLKPLVDFFNTHFQLYGRQIKIVPYPSQQAVGQFDGTKVNDPALQRADAAEVVGRKVFASFDFLDNVPYSWALPVYRDVLTKHKIVSVSGGASPPYGTEKDLAARAPYEWSYYPTIDTLMRNVGTMTCRQLAGKPASHAKDPALASATRKFAMVFPTDEHLGGPIPGLSSLLSILDGCGIHSPEVIRYDANDDNQVLPQLEKLRQLKEAGITSLIFFPYTGSAARGAPQTLADRAQYYPEWITIGWNKYLTDIWSGSPQNQKTATFGVAMWNKQPQLALENWFQAYTLAGGSTTGAAGMNDGLAFYNELLLLASGIQMAGPRLTPESFAEGLRSTTFPNPGAGAAPFYQATVGFGPGDAAMTNDFAAFWFDPSTNWDSYQGQPGLNFYRTDCYAVLGRRWSQETWPTADLFFRNGCR